MSSTHLGRAISKSRRARAANGRDHNEGGFTLIELLIVCVILPIVVGAIAVGLVSILSLQGSVSNRVGDSADAQTVSVNFEQDVHSAAELTTSASAECGSSSQTQLLGLEWNLNDQTNTYQTVVSYVEVQNGSSYSLARQYCASGASSSPTSTTTISSDVPSGQSPPTISFASGAADADPSNGWVSSQGVSGVTFSITEPASDYAYTLVGVPASSSSSGQTATISSPTTSCGFANAGTGTYATTLCFIDFTPWNTQTGSSCGTAPDNGIEMSVGVTGTPYTMTFCISVQSVASNGSSITGGTTGTGYNDIHAVAFPTYSSPQGPSGSEAYLGNNSAYTGVPGYPALYTEDQGSTSTITITNIQVLDSAGDPATSWELVTGDAESTDTGESITWTSNEDLSLLADSPTSEIGNACQYSSTQVPSGSYSDATWLTGLGSTTVECASSDQLNKTGTVMLEAAAPTTLTATLVGEGLQAIFVGLLLPS